MRPAGIESNVFKAVSFILFADVVVGAGVEFYNVAWGTGAWLGEFSLKWATAFLWFAIFCAASLFTLALLIWRTPSAASFKSVLIRLRVRMGPVRWLLGLGALVLPIWLLQYSPWGVVFSKTDMRLVIWGIAVAILAFLITADSARAVTWQATLAAILLSGAGFALIIPFKNVTNYPFALGWSEGNRLWDYSLLFGKDRYTYLPADPPAAYLEPGRQLVGALPFLLPQMSIVGERLWIALMAILPYLLLGWLAFRPPKMNSRVSWILAGVWGFMFLNQGPIHAPLLVCAILAALAWLQPLWLAVPLVAVAGYFAQASRFTWILAPAIWAVMLEFGGAALDNQGRVPRKDWWRALLMGLAGLIGGVLVSRFISMMGWNALLQSGAPGVVAGGVTISSVATAAGEQPLLWYRLLPNATFGSGILLGLLIAAGPLIVLLIHAAKGHWKLNPLQKLCIGLPTLAFLVVGLIVSTKIGGGGDLHNMDMFLISLLFSAALAWRAGGADWLASVQDSAPWVQAVILLAIAIPAFQPLMDLRPLEFSQDTGWLTVLADVQRPKDLGSLPGPEAVAAGVGKLRDEVKTAQTHGDVLFMDQRQLLTFGYIQDVRLVPEYEKKRMMDEALSSNAAYFKAFYRDLAAQRFSLIVTDPLRTPIKDSDYGFGEENNAWVKWVAKPVLCYYDEKDTLSDVRVELLVPRQGTNDCSSALP